MTSYANLTGSSIRRATVRGVQLDAIAARRSTERLLAQMPDAAPGMSASAVLCVREVSVHVRGAVRSLQAGGKALEAEMQRLARIAARPVLGGVPSSAEAVVFADKAELLSCLARDYALHRLLQGWWWRVLLPGPDLAAAALRMWVEEAAHAPVALSRLAQSGHAVEFVRSLVDGVVKAIVQGILRAHGLALVADTGLGQLVLLPQVQPASLLQSNRKHKIAPESLQQAKREIHEALPEAWRPGLNLPQRLLLAVGLSLVRVPQLVHGAAYAQVLPELLDEDNNSIKTTIYEGVKPASFARKLTPQHAAAFTQEGEAITGLRSAELESWQDNAAAGRQEASQMHRQQGESVVPVRKPPLPAFRQPSGEDAALSESSNMEVPARDLQKCGAANPDADYVNQPEAVEKLAAPVPQLAKAANEAQVRHTAHEKFASPVAETLPFEIPQYIETEFGGVFFLCNAALALDLYPDFTRPLERGLELCLWDFLALAAVDLCGSAVRQDPLWRLLADLAGRKPGKKLGAGFIPPDEWRMPAGWLLPFAEEAAAWQWELVDKRLRVRHPAGFMVLDVLRNELSVAAQLQAELLPYAVPAIEETKPGKRRPLTSFARWRGWMMPYLGRRVAKALGDVHWRRACKGMMQLHGRIECDAERLSVHFPLEKLPVEVRIAGLDRDPGWIPAAGRDVRFYFGCEDA